MTATLPIYLAFAPSRAAEQLAEALRRAPGFTLVGHSDDIELVARDLRCFTEAPALVLLDADVCSDAGADVRALVRQHAVRVVAVAFRAEAAPSVEAMLACGAVHGQTLQVDATGRVEPRRIQRLFHLLTLLADVRGLAPGRHNPQPTQSPARRRAGELEAAVEADATQAHAGAASSWTSDLRAARQERAEPSYTSDPSGGRTRRGRLAHFQLIGIVSSTGGLSALETVLAGLPHDFPLPVAVVQHLSVGTEDEFVRLLGSHCELSVCLVQRTVRPKPGTVYVAPGGQHLRLDSLGQLTLSDEPRAAPYRPSASVLLASMAEAFGARCIGVVLTGMGNDGAEGLLRIRQCGGRTLVQDRSTSRIFGMPHAAIELDAAERVLALPEIAGELMRLARIGRGD